MSDVFWVNAYVGVQSIPHFLDFALPHGGACVVRFRDVRKQTHHRFQRRKLDGGQFLFGLPHYFIKQIKQIKHRTKVVPLDELFLVVNLSVERTHVVQDEFLLFIGRLLAEQLTLLRTTERTVKTDPR